MKTIIPQNDNKIHIKYSTNKMKNHNPNTSDAGVVVPRKPAARQSKLVRAVHDKDKKIHIKYSNNKMKKTQLSREFAADINRLFNILTNNQRKKEKKTKKQTRKENAIINKASLDDLAKGLYYLGHEIKNPGAPVPPPRKKQLESLKKEIQNYDAQARVRAVKPNYKIEKSKSALRGFSNSYKINSGYNIDELRFLKKCRYATVKFLNQNKNIKTELVLTATMRRRDTHTGDYEYKKCYFQSNQLLNIAGSNVHDLYDEA